MMNRNRAPLRVALQLRGQLDQYRSKQIRAGDATGAL